MVRLKNQPKLRTNLDTDFLKLIAVLSMTVDHVGAVFFPEYPVFRWIGRKMCIRDRGASGHPWQRSGAAGIQL